MEEKIGVSKEIDNLGRLVIPKEMRELFDFDGRVELVIVEDEILIRNPEYMLVRRKENRRP